MEALSKLGVQLELPREDLATSLALLCTEEQLKSIREALFEEAKWSGLAHPKDILVKRLNRTRIRTEVPTTSPASNSKEWQACHFGVPANT